MCLICTKNGKEHNFLIWKNNWKETTYYTMTFVKSQKASEYKKIPRKPHTLVYNLYQESPKVGVTVIDPSVVMDCCSDDVEEKSPEERDAIWCQPIRCK